MATTVVRKEDAASRQRPRLGRALTGLTALALAAMSVVVVSVLTQGPRSSPVAQESTTPIYTADEAAVIRLVADGVLPASVLDQEPFRTKQLVNEGVLPPETLESQLVSVPPLYCREERALMAAVAAGVVPEEVLEGEPFRTKRLIGHGLIPRQTAEPC
jgi:hypothetical protein